MGTAAERASKKHVVRFLPGEKRDRISCALRHRVKRESFKEGNSRKLRSEQGDRRKDCGFSSLQRNRGGAHARGKLGSGSSFPVCTYKPQIQLPSHGFIFEKFYHRYSLSPRKAHGSHTIQL